MKWFEGSKLAGRVWVPQARGVDHAEHCVLILGTKVFPVGAVVQNPPASAGDARDMGSIPESGSSPGVENGNPVFLPGKLLGQRSLVGCSPWGYEELDMIEGTHTLLVPGLPSEFSLYCWRWKLRSHTSLISLLRGFICHLPVRGTCNIWRTRETEAIIALQHRRQRAGLAQRAYVRICRSFCSTNHLLQCCQQLSSSAVVSCSSCDFLISWIHWQRSLNFLSPSPSKVLEAPVLNPVLCDTLSAFCSRLNADYQGTSMRKRCLLSLAREMQVKTTSWPFSPISWIKSGRLVAVCWSGGSWLPRCCKKWKLTLIYEIGDSQVVLVVKKLPADAGVTGDMDSVPGSGRSPGEGNGNPLQYSCLENPTEREAWRAIVRGAAKSRTRLKQLSMHAMKLTLISTRGILVISITFIHTFVNYMFKTYFL